MQEQASRNDEPALPVQGLPCAPIAFPLQEEHTSELGAGVSSEEQERGLRGFPGIGSTVGAMGSHAAALVFILALRVSSLASGSKLQPHM